MKTALVLLMLFAHGLTQLGLSLPDQTWRGWLSPESTHLILVCTIALFAARLIADVGLCCWIIGPERLRGAAMALGRLARPAARERERSPRMPRGARLS